MRSLNVARLQAFAVPIVLALSLGVPAAVTAHAEFKEASPADGATVEGTPSEIVAVFSEALAADGSVLALRDAAGAELANGGPDPDDPARLVITEVPALAPGEYEVRWTAASDDGHLERDTWTFTVTAAMTPSPSPTPAPTATPAAPGSASSSPTSPPSAEPTATPSATPPPDDAGATGGDVVIPIVAGLAIVAIAGGILFSRRGRA